VLLIAIALYLIPKEERVIKPFVATLIAPDETKPTPLPKPPALKKERQRSYRQNFRTGETNTPKVFSAVKKGASGNRQSSGETAQQQSRSAASLRPETTLGPAPKPATMRDKLFDPNEITKVVHSNTGRKTTSIKGTGISADIGDVASYGWIQRVIEKIQVAWKYPQELIERRIISDVDVIVTFKKNGDLGNTQVIRTSGYKVLDDSSIKALQDAAPYWPLPDDLGKDELSVKFHFYVP
jgi:protein TonB